MDRLDELAVFIAILDAGSLTGAGRKLRRSPPSVTRSLAALEERVGARLVERSTRRLAPTEAGRQLAEHARRLLSGYDSAIGEISGAPLRGVLRVTAPLVFGRRHVAPVIGNFLDAYPSMRAELILSDRNLDLIEHEIDVAVRIGPLSDSSLVARRVGAVGRLLVASPAYIERRGLPRRPADLAEHDVIFASDRADQQAWRFRSAGREQVVRLVPRLAVNEIDAMLLAVRAGRGIGRPLSYQVVDDLAAGHLVRLIPKFEPEPLPVHIVMPSTQRMPPKARAFVDLAAPALGALDVLRGVPEALLPADGDGERY
ncbi:LysR family transcriptional regulator [Microvirga sp. GCM10011540]|uniref:LysR family transcriptional regulator n=1 Tax=Microvirga sp. GCM10011540 TaxID=3317338 RepID=UPI0036202795